MASYTYKVLREEEGGEPPETIYRPVGEFKAKGPDLAALLGAELEGKTGTYVAIPQRNFNETPIVPTTGFAIGDRDPDPPEPTGEGAAGGDLDPRLHPEWTCETEECGHRPGDHGAKGLGICRVDGCPCGKAKYPGLAT
jgi:hypothetical protein